MALPKVLDEILARLERIEAKLEAQQTKAAPHLTDAQRAELLAAQLEFDSYMVKEIAERVDSLTDEQRHLLRFYEQAHKNRPGVLKALQGN